MATRTYHETEYTNTIAEVKKHFKKVGKKEGWLVSLFIWCEGDIDFKDTMMDVDIVTDIKDQNGRYIGVHFCYQPKEVKEYILKHSNEFEEPDYNKIMKEYQQKLMLNQIEKEFE